MFNVKCSGTYFCLCGMARGTLKKCSRCNEPRRKNGAYCLGHHAEAMRKWRKAYPMSVLARKKMNARSYLHTYVKRGYVQKGVCEICGDQNVHGHHSDYDKPLQVNWLCKKHHIELHNKLRIT